MNAEKIIAIAKREHNTKRSFLVVNRYQGKHVPISPDKPFHMFSALADLTAERYRGERLLLIGFAETATAIGETLAVRLDTDYMQTTRENLPGAEYLYFSESHSHAAEQRVVKNDLDQVIAQTDRIVFVEDEVTTGNTIGKIVRLIRQTYGKKLNFAAASLLNGMDEEARARYQTEQIDLVYLVKTDHSGYSEIAETYINDGSYYECVSFGGNGTFSHEDLHAGKNGFISREGLHVGENRSLNIEELEKNPWELKAKEIIVSGFINARRLHKGREYQKACENLWRQIKERISFGEGKNILVLGTEEFMYAPLYVAQNIQEMGNCVKCHATTRSPIMVSKHQEYPLHERYELASFYQKARTTYVYDLDAYDLVLILTDAEPGENGLELEQPDAESVRSDSASEQPGAEPGENSLELEQPGAVSLSRALYSCGNREIYLVRWCEN